MPRIAYVVSNPCVSDARVIKIARAAAEAGYDVHIFATLGIGTPSYETIDGITFHRLQWSPSERLRNASRILRILKRSNRKLAGFLIKRLNRYLKYRFFADVFSPHIESVRPDIVHAHDLICLPAAARAAKAVGAKLVYDAHELEVHRNPPLPFFQKRFVRYIERTYATRADAVITVGRKVGEVLGRSLGRRDIHILYNAPPIEPCPRDIRTDLQLPPSAPLILYVGKVTAGRGVGDIVAILPKLPGVTFATVGPCDERNMRTLKKQASKLGVTDRFRIMPSVPFKQVVGYIHGADIGVISVEPLCLSYRYCMPNKLFEMSFANIPIISNELDEIREFLEENGNGKIVDFEDKTSLIYGISRILHEKSALLMDQPRLEHLHRKYSWEAQKAKLLAIYRGL